MSAIDRLLGLVEDSSIKSPCRVVSLTNITLNGLQTIDAVALAQDDRVLVNGQTDPTQNGIYAADTGDWQRTPDCNGTRDLVKGTIVIVTSGTVYAETSWELTTTAPVVGQALSWVRTALSTPSPILPGFVTVMDYGGDPTGVADLSLSIQAAHDALPAAGGIIYVPPGLTWSVRSAVVLTKTCDVIGASKGTTILNVGTTFAHSGGVLFKTNGSKINLSRFTILGDIADPTLDYIAVQVDTNSGFEFDIDVNGCGVGFDFVQGNTGWPRNCSVRYFSVAGMRFGGSASKFSSEYRIYGGVITNPNTTGATNAITAAGDVIHMADTSAVTVGDGFAAYNIPVGTKVLSKTPTTVTLDTPVTGAIANPQYVRFGKWLRGACLEFKNNAFDVNITDQLIAGGEYLIKITGEPNIGAGLYRADSLYFNNMNATASTYFGIYITGGTVVYFNDSHLGDVVAGNLVYASSSTNVAADVSNIHFTDSLVGGAALDGCVFDYANNIIFNDTYSVGHGFQASNTYSAVKCTAHCTGRFEFLGGHAGIDNVDNSVGPVALGINLAAGSFAGANDSVTVETKITGLTTPPWIDGSVPVYPLKTFDPFGGGRPAFRVGKSGTQVIAPAAGDVQVVFPAEQYDYGNYFAANAFSPPAGVYFLQAMVTFQAADAFTLSIMKNGSAQATQVVTMSQSGLVADTVVSDGNDVFTVVVNIVAGGTIDLGQDVTYFSGG